MKTLPKVVVAICTYKRNEPLRTLLLALIRVAEATRTRAEIGVLIVDDNSDQRARSVAQEFKNSFKHGLQYRFSGKGNISVARNIALNNACEESDWVAMIDDDCEPEPNWLCAYLDVLDVTGADCATGPMNLRVPAGSPRWLQEQPFFDDVRFDFADLSEIETAATNNSIIRASFLRDHPEIRFLPELGKLGGEDMVFYRSARASGLQIRFVRSAGVWGNEPAERANFKHQIKYRYWIGNSMFVTNSYFGEARPRLFLRGGKIAAQGIARPFTRMLRLQSPQWRYAAASCAVGVGLIAGALGFRQNH